MSGEGMIPSDIEIGKRTFTDRFAAEDTAVEVTAKMLNALPDKAAQGMKRFVTDYGSRFREEFGDLPRYEEAIKHAARDAMKEILRAGNLPETCEQLGTQLREASTAHFDHNLKAGACPFHFRDALQKEFGEVLSGLADDAEQACQQGRAVR